MKKDYKPPQITIVAYDIDNMTCTDASTNAMGDMLLIYNRDNEAWAETNWANFQAASVYEYSE